MKAMLLPWRGQWVPHAVLDINRTCDITCRGCYNHRGGEVKPLSQVRDEIEQLIQLRRLHTLTILGGEPTLHPQLAELVELAKSHVRRVALVTNGMRFDAPMAKQLKQAGLDLVLFHVDHGQHRADLGEQPTASDIDTLRRAKAATAREAGIAVGMQVIGYGNAPDAILAAIDFVLRTPGVSHLLVTNFTWVEKFRHIRGSVGTLEAAVNSVKSSHPDELVNADVERMLTVRGMHPFAYVGAHHDAAARRWISYQCCAGARVHPLTSSLFERLMMRLAPLLSRRYVFFYRPGLFTLALQLVGNLLSGGNVRGSGGAILDVLAGGAMESKHIVFQEGPGIENGTLVYCRDCPDATLRDGRLVPLCLTDKVMP